MKIDIIGGGVAGCVAGLELAAQGNDIRIRDYRPGLLEGASRATPCRLGLGLHYFDEITAFRCLSATIGFVRHYPGFKISDRLTEATHLRNGWYFITKDSLFDPEVVRAFYEKLQGQYAELVALDPGNEVFGPPEQFIRVLDPSEYQDQVDMDKVAIGFETAECSLDFPRFSSFLIEQLKAHPNIQVFTNEEVLKIQQADDHDGFTLMIQEPQKPETLRIIETDFVINATWENIEALNQASGFPMKSERTMRTKGMIEVRLPESLAQAHSMFFGFGAHASFTNLGPSPEGYSRGFITFEPVTNIDKTTNVIISERSRRLLYQGGTAEEIELLANQILQNVGHDYIKGMEAAQCLGASFGIVKNDGVVDIFSSSSASHQRRESGISEQQFGWISNASMKLLLCLENARSVALLVKRHEKALANIRLIAHQNVENHFPKEGSRTMTHFFVKYLQQHAHKRRVDVASNTNRKHFSNELLGAIKRKQACNRELKDFDSKININRFSNALLDIIKRNREIEEKLDAVTAPAVPFAGAQPVMLHSLYSPKRATFRKSQSSPELRGLATDCHQLRSVSPLR